MLFSIYGLEFDVPKESKIQIYKGSLYFEGTVEFTDFENNVIKADWNDTSKVLGARRNIKDFFKDFLDKIRADRDVTKFDLQEFPHEGLAEHDYYFYKLVYVTERKFPHKELSDYLIGFGMICKNTDRVVVIQYRPLTGQAGAEEAVMKIIRSFRCRCIG
jgi:hypothetical protein